MNKVNYDPVLSTGVLSSSIYEDGNIITLGEKTHMALIENSDKKFAVLEVISATDKDNNSCILQKQACEDGIFAVLAIACLKTKKVFSENNINSARRLSGGMSISEILALEAGVTYRLTKTQDGYKKPYGWVEGDELVPNNSYRLDPVSATSQSTTKK